MRVFKLKNCCLTRKLLLVAAMFGIEAGITFKLIFMIANIQTLGVPVRYASIPGTVGAVCGLLCIPTLGLFMEKWARSKVFKAKILACAMSVQMLGMVLIFMVNVIKLFVYDVDKSMTSLNVIHVNATTRQPMEHGSPPPDEKIYTYAILAMAGYSLNDCGYDSGSCFLKAFALASIATEEQSSVIVQAVFVSSLGGCMIAVLGSVGLGTLLTAGTSHDVNAAQSALLSALCFLLLALGLTLTLTTGFCCTPSGSSSYEEITHSDETAATDAASSEQTTATDAASSGQTTATDAASSRQTTATDAASSGQTTATDAASSGQTTATDAASSGQTTATDAASSRQTTATDAANSGQTTATDAASSEQTTGVCGVLRRQRKLIVINLSTFFLQGSLYAYEVYVVNFVGEGILGGDPQADPTSEQYKNYVRGIAIGSSGTLIYYISFTLFNSCQGLLLGRIGWKVELLVICTGNVIVNLTCAVTAKLWTFYMTTVWSGFFRAVAFTLPYVIANEFATKQTGHALSSGGVVAAVACMLPCGFLLCSAVMGPLIDVTGNPATPVYYTAATSMMGMVANVWLKSD